MKARIRRLRRYRHIVMVLAKYGFGELAESVRGRLPIALGKAKGKGEEHTGHTRPARLRMALQELGPTFIKLGQFLSTRPDIVSQEYIEELEKLQDKVEPEKSELIIAQVEKELDAPLDEIFSRFDKSPLAAGSIAQVHRAKTHHGEEVVLKVRRPNIVATVEAEIKILEDIAALLKTAFFENEVLDPRQMVAELGQAIEQEVDLTNEKRNQNRFINNFADDAQFHIPKVYEEYCTDGVLTMEYIEGLKLGNIQQLTEQGYDPKIIAQRGTDFVLRQIFEMGFFHTDPHPGNFFIMSDNILAPLDFGQVAWLSSRERRLITDLVLAIVDNEGSAIARALEQQNMFSEQTDFDKLTRDIEFVLETYHNMPLREISFGQAMNRIFETIRKNRVRPPAQFTLMLKSLMTAENLAKKLDPDFNIIDHLKPYARRVGIRDVDPKQILRGTRKAMFEAGGLMSRLPDELNNILGKFRQGKFQVRIHHEHLEELSNTFDKGSNRISFSLIIAALLIGSSMLVAQEGMVLGFIRLQTLGIIGYLTATAIGIWLVISIIRSRHY